MASSWKKISRVEWQTEEPDSDGAREKTRLGALQRIADATEAMAKNHDDLVRDRDMYKRWYEAERNKTERMARVIAGLRGYIGRLKRDAARRKARAK